MPCTTPRVTSRARDAEPGSPKRSASSTPTTSAPMHATSRTIPPTPVAAPLDRQHLARMVVALVRRAPAPGPSHGDGQRSPRPASSPGPSTTCGAAVGSRLSRWRVDLYEQCSLHRIPNSTASGHAAAGGRAARSAASPRRARARRRARRRRRETAAGSRASSARVRGTVRWATLGGRPCSVTDSRGTPRAGEQRVDVAQEVLERRSTRPERSRLSTRWTRRIGLERRAERRPAVERRAARAAGRSGRPRRARSPAAVSASSTRCENTSPPPALEVRAHPALRRPRSPCSDVASSSCAHEVGDQERVGQDHALGRRVADVALVPQRLVLERRPARSARSSRASPHTRSQRTGLRLCGIAEEPFWPALERLLGLAHLGALEVRGSRARCCSSVPRQHRQRAQQRGVAVALAPPGSPPARAPGPARASASLPRSPDRDGRASRPRPRTCPPRSRRARASSRARSRPSSSLHTRHLRPKVIGSAWMPCVRPTIGVWRWRSASAGAAARSAASRRASSAPGLDDLERQRRVDQVGRGHARRGRAARRRRSTRRACERNAITSWRTSASIASHARRRRCGARRAHPLRGSRRHLAPRARAPPSPPARPRATARGGASSLQTAAHRRARVALRSSLAPRRLGQRQGHAHAWTCRGSDPSLMRSPTAAP